MDRFGDVLNRLLAQVFKGGRDLALDLLNHGAGNQDSAGIGESFKAGRHVHAIAIDVPILDDDVTEVDADAVGDRIL